MKLLSPGEAIQAALKTGEPMAVVPEPHRNGAVDVFFPIVHGTYGEDGTIQGLLELAGVPYVGAGVLGSAVGMDKDVMKRLLREAGLPVGDFWVTRAKDIEAFIREFGKELPYPYSSSPQTLVLQSESPRLTSAAELPAALAFAAEFDRKIVIEKGIDAREIEISVLGNDELRASIPGEIIPSREFYDYQAKYVDDDSRLIIPAPLSEEQVRQAQDLAIRSFQALDCSGMARVDLFLEKPDREISRQRNQYAARLYVNQHVSQTLGSYGACLCGSGRSPYHSGGGAPLREEEAQNRNLNFRSSQFAPHCSSIFEHEGPSAASRAKCS